MRASQFGCASQIPSSRPPPGHFACGYVFPDDAEDIKAHRWFRSVNWATIHATTPPFVPHITSVDDTHYFDEEEPISEMSSSSFSSVEPAPTKDEISAALRPFSPGVQTMAASLIRAPFDSLRLRGIDAGIDAMLRLSPVEKEVLKQFVRVYGRRERRRPRDKLLRDPNTRGPVLNVRRQTAFLGYTWRRRRTGGYLHAGPDMMARMMRPGIQMPDLSAQKFAFQGRSRSYM